MLDTAGSAAAPAARCRNRRRGSFILNPPSTFASFDHLVGKCEQRVRYVEPHRLCGFQIEHEQEARRLLDRQVGGLVPLKMRSTRAAERSKISRRSGPYDIKPP